MALVTLDEFKSSAYWESSRNWSDAQAQQALNVAEARFYRLTLRDRYGYWLEPVEKSLKLHGTGLAVQRCPYPVLGLSAISVNDTDVLDNVDYKGHYIFAKDGQAIFKKGTLNVVLTGTFGDPDYAGQDIPWDVKDAVMRMAWHHLRRERLTNERVASVRGPGAPPPYNNSTDPQVKEVIQAWTKRDLTRVFDFR